MAVKKRQVMQGRSHASSYTSVLVSCGRGTALRNLVGRLAVASVVCAACGVTDEELPPGVQDPATIQTPVGAVGFYRGVLTLVLPQAVDAFVFESAFPTDEYTLIAMPPGIFSQWFTSDARVEISASETYNQLHALRAQARDARGFLAAYASDSSPAMRGHMYSLEGYADVFLADLFCSGIPLSTVDFQGDYTLASGSTTREIYSSAAELFDSALALTNDSIRLQHVAAVGKGRALLAVGEYAAAAAAVASVPDAFAMDVSPPSVAVRFMESINHLGLGGEPTLADNEGLTGLDYRSSADPRAQFASLPGTHFSGDTVYVPAKYTPIDGTSWTYRIASGVEARLIEAEAALRANPADGIWLDRLNHLRQTAWTTIVPAASGPLPDLADPGTDSARVDLLFRERAFWLHVTGHRQGDLRRLIREYGRLQQTVYPTGSYPAGTAVYGDQVVARVPEQERELNPRYDGCFNLEA